MILEVEGAKRRLVIPITTVEDSGEYACDTADDSVAFLVNITGKQRVRLTIMDHFPFIITLFTFIFHLEPAVTLSRPSTTPDKLESFAGKPIVLEIEVSRPTAEVKWCLNGREIEESSNVTITEDGLTRRLTIHSPTQEDSGQYTCDALDDKVDFQVKVSGKWQKVTSKVCSDP